MRAHACPKCPQTLILRVWSKILVFKRVENENTGIGHESDPPKLCGHRRGRCDGSDVTSPGGRKLNFLLKNIEGPDNASPPLFPRRAGYPRSLIPHPPRACLIFLDRRSFDSDQHNGIFAMCARRKHRRASKPPHTPLPRPHARTRHTHSGPRSLAQVSLLPVFLCESRFSPVKKQVFVAFTPHVLCFCCSIFVRGSNTTLLCLF